MSGATNTGTEKYIDKIGQADEAHDETIRQIRAEALYDTDLSDLERAVLGLTGSPERLGEYKKLEEKVAQHIGKPLIIAADVRSKEGDIAVSKAYGGIISDGLEVSLSQPLGVIPSEDENPPIDSATMFVPVLPVVAYRHSVYNKSVTYVNEDTGEFDRERGIGRLRVAHIRPNYGGNRNQAGEYPVHDYMSPDVYIGRTEIYTSELFQRGVSHLLRVVEEI